MRISFHIARKRPAWAQTCSLELFAKIGRVPVCAPTPAGFCCVTECDGNAEAEPGQPTDSCDCGKPPGDWNGEFRDHERLNSGRGAPAKICGIPSCTLPPCSRHRRPCRPHSGPGTHARRSRRPEAEPNRAGGRRGSAGEGRSRRTRSIRSQPISREIRMHHIAPPPARTAHPGDPALPDGACARERAQDPGRSGRRG